MIDQWKKWKRLFIKFQEKTLLGQEELFFTAKSNVNNLVQLLEEKVDYEQGSFLNFKKKDFYGFVKKERVYLILNKNSLWGPSVYCFDGKIIDNADGSTIYLKYRMRMFFKIFLLLWFNIIFLFVTGFIIFAAWLFFKYLFFSSTEMTGSLLNFVINSGILILGSIFLTLFGFFIVRLMKYTETRNKVVLYRVLLGIGCEATRVRRTP